MVNVHAAVTAASVAALMSPIGAYISKLCRVRILKVTLGVFLLSSSALIACKSFELLDLSLLQNFLDQNNPTHKYALFIGIGSIVGFLSGFIGVGGGLLLVPTYVIVAGMDQKVAVATSLATVV